jgi:hypothetical protein
MRSSKRKRRLAMVAAFYVLATIVARRRGYEVGGSTVVRCNRGHLFTTIWIPGATFKALKLGWWRLQWCPVGRHVALVRPVKTASLSRSERRFAAKHHDAHVP